MRTLEFYFDFSSSYSYIASDVIDDLAEDYGWQVKWQPIALGAVFQSMGHELPTRGSAKQRYIWHDVERSAKMVGCVYKWPKPFPFNSIPLSRAYIYLAKRDQALARKFGKALFCELYGNGADTRDTERLLRHAAGAVNTDANELISGTLTTEVKTALKSATEEAIKLGVFGAPTFVVDGELFWGADRLNQLRQHLSSLSTQ